MIAERLKSLRLEKGISKTKLTAELGIDIDTYSQYEAGSIHPDNGDLIPLSDYYDVTINYIIGKSDTKNPIDSPTVTQMERTKHLRGTLKKR